MSDNVNKDIQNAIRAANVFTEAEKNTFERVREMNKKLHDLFEDHSPKYIDPSIINWMANIYVIGYERGLQTGRKLDGFSPLEIQNILIDYGQHDGRFKPGDWIRYTPSEIYDILKEKESEIENEFN